MVLSCAKNVQNWRTHDVESFVAQILLQEPLFFTRILWIQIVTYLSGTNLVLCEQVYPEEISLICRGMCIGECHRLWSNCICCCFSTGKVHWEQSDNSASRAFFKTLSLDWAFNRTPQMKCLSPSNNISETINVMLRKCTQTNQGAVTRTFAESCKSNSNINCNVSGSVTPAQMGAPPIWYRDAFNKPTEVLSTFHTYRIVAKTVYTCFFSEFRHVWYRSTEQSC